MAEEVKKWFNQAMVIKAEYNQLKESHADAIKTLHSRCRKSEEGHIWLKIPKTPISYKGHATYLKVCQCCGFCVRTSETSNVDVVKQALSTEIVLSPEKKAIRQIAIEEYGEKLVQLNSLEERFKKVEKQVREIRAMCNSFLGESSAPIVIRVSECDDYCFD